MCQMLWYGSVVDLDKNSENTVALRNLGKKIHKDDRVNMSFLTIGDGTILAFKKWAGISLWLESFLVIMLTYVCDIFVCILNFCDSCIHFYNVVFGNL